MTLPANATYVMLRGTKTVRWVLEIRGFNPLYHGGQYMCQCDGGYKSRSIDIHGKVTAK